jgi:hypothetical protein
MHYASLISEWVDVLTSFVIGPEFKFKFKFKFQKKLWVGKTSNLAVSPDSRKSLLDTFSGRLWFHLDNVLLVILVPQADQNSHLLRVIREYTFCSCESHSEGWDRSWARLGLMSTSGILYTAVSNSNCIGSFRIFM